MTHLNTTHVAPNAAPGALARLATAVATFCLRLLLAIPAALAAGVVEAAGAIGKAADMAYADPFTQNRHHRK